MTVGGVTSIRTAVVPVRVSGPGGGEEISATIDTGFTGHLTLTPAVVARLGLPRHAAATMLLANGQLHRFDTHLAHVEWHGRRLAVPVLASPGGCFIGMSLLYGSLVSMHVVDGGNVTIERIP